MSINDNIPPNPHPVKPPPNLPPPKQVSQPEKFICFGVHVHSPNNEKNTWVRYDDYAALAAENERLRKAGDAMVEDIFDCYESEGYDPKYSDSIKLWNAAKEGRDAK